MQATERGLSIRNEDGCTVCVERKMLATAFKVTYILAVIASMVAWIWMFVAIVGWAIGF